MNVLRKQSALRKLNDFLQKNMSIEEAIAALHHDEAKYTEEEINEISDSFTVEDGTSHLPQPEEIKAAPASKGKLDLSKFDYKNLTGESFKEYVKLVGDRSYLEVDREEGTEKPVIGMLKENDMYDFQLHKVDVIMKDRFPGIAGTPKDFNGIRVKSDQPEMVTRIPVKTALELNAQIMNAHSRAGHGKYYLLKK
jgi:hypothetical protein